MISVIMSTFHETEEQLSGAIESILSQTYQDFEFLIFLDDPSNNLHKQIIKSYAEKDSRIRFFINRENMGLTKTLNKAISLAQGKYIARMDADDLSYPIRFERQIKYLESNEYDLIGGIAQIIDETGNEVYSIRKVPSDPNKIRKALCYGQCLAHPTWLGKKAVFDILSGYRSIPLCEDYDFTLRAQLNNFKISNLNEVVLKYRMTTNSISRNNLFEQYLYMKYITSQYKKGKIADLLKAEEYVTLHNNKKISDRYTKANHLFNQLLKALNSKRYFEFLILGFKIVLTSRHYLDKVRRFCLLIINS